MSEPFQHTLGPRSARVVLVGEAWGEQEEKVGRPFVGAAGQELSRLLGEVGLPRKDLLLTNVLALRPPNNKMEALCGTKSEVGKGYVLPAISQGKYLLNKYLPELTRLRMEIEDVRPNLVVALGNTACWALLRSTKIGQIRGTVAESLLVPNVKVLPTYHPAAVLRNWSFRPIVLADLMKAKREALFKEIRRPKRQVLVNPTLAEVIAWTDQVLKERPSLLAPDIETGAGQIKCIGFAKSRGDALVVPFVDLTRESGSYWSTLEEELTAWNQVRRLLESDIPKVFQNGLFDLSYLARVGLRPKACLQDTMLLHHSLYPELPKALGFLGSIYSNEASWKLMRFQREEFKRDE